MRWSSLHQISSSSAAPGRLGGGFFGQKNQVFLQLQSLTDELRQADVRFHVLFVQNFHRSGQRGLGITL